MIKAMTAAKGSAPACALRWLFAAALALTAPSAAETTLGQPWSNATFIAGYGPFSNVLVIAVTEEPKYRPLLEDAFVARIGKTKADAVASVEIMAADAEVTEQTVKAAVAASGRRVDIVLLTHLFRVEEVDIVNVSDPGTKRSERDFALGLWNDWRNARDYALDAGVTQRLRYVLENSVYDLETAELIWTVQSHSLDPKSPEEIIDSVSKQVAKALEKDSVI